MPLVSVVIPTYNSAIYLPETINSILEQDFDDFEIIVIDDRSTDNTREVLNAIDSDKIRYYRLEENHGGPSLPRKIGVKEAHGEFIALCDSDDLFVSGRLSIAVNFLQNYSEVGMVFTDEQKFDDETGKELGNFLDGYEQFQALPKKEVGENSFVIAPEDAFSCLFFENYIIPSGVTIRRSIFKDIGSFDERLTNGDDKDMWFRVTRKYSIGFINQIGFRYRIRDSSISKRGASLAYNRIKVIQKQINAGLLGNLHNICRKNIARNYCRLGYHYRTKGNMRKAREVYLKSLRITLSMDAIKGLLISLLGKNIYLALRATNLRRDIL